MTWKAKCTVIDKVDLGCRMTKLVFELVLYSFLIPTKFEPLSEAPTSSSNAFWWPIDHLIAREIAEALVSPRGDIEAIAIDRVDRMIDRD